MSLIEARGLSKHFKVLNHREGLVGAMKDLFSTDFRVVKAVDDISFAIEPGEIVGYIGPNGAGKSTTIKMLTGILQPTSGRLIVDSIVPYENRQKNVRNMGVIFGQRTQLWWDLPVVESFKILRDIYSIDENTYNSQLGLFQELVDLRSLYSTPVRKLSLGQRMLCDLAAAFLHNPKVILLDEPTIGLDISVKSKIRTVIRELNDTHRTTIILTTHDLGDVEALCRRLMIIDKGKIIYDGEINRVTELFGVYRTLKVQIFQYGDGMMDLLKARLTDKFGKASEIVVENTEPGWTDVTVNQAVVPLLDVLNFLMGTLPVKDVRIVEVSMVSVVQKIYDGALR
jgi:ABC-2 type transport system ATP-binding protein